MKRVQIYRQQCIGLAGSLIIKSETIARTMNKPLMELSKPIPHDKREWRFYLHLSGQKHHLDVPVMLTSLDTNEEIELTVDALKIHKKTSNVYRYNPEYIERLLVRYPTMNVYIRGVFNPVDINYAITAPDCTILYHDPRFVEKQEASLLLDISKFIVNVHKRFWYEGYEASEDCMPLAIWSTIYAMLPGVIQSIRKKYCHTQETHSFHIEAFLASHQYLDEFIPYLTLKQKMYLYRNIRWIERNTGQDGTLKELVDVFLTGWNMPTSEYDVGQKIHDVSESLTPTPIVYEKPMNFRDRLDGRDAKLLETYELVQKEVNLAYDNPNNLEEHLDDLDMRLRYTQYPEQPSKVIEVTAVDPSELNKFNLPEVLVNEWLHTAALGIYDIYHEILNPLNGDTLRLSTRELFVFFWYAAYKGFSGYSEVDIPTFLCQGVQLKRWASADEYMAFLPEAYPERYDGLIDFYTSTHHEIYGNIISPDELFSNAQAILNAKLARYRYGYNYERTEDRLTAQLAFNYNYLDLRCDLKIPEKTFEAFFMRFGVDYEHLSEEAWQDVATDCLNSATAIDSNSEISHKDIQSAMVRLLTRLSSYTIHFASRMATDPPIVTDPLLLTVGTTLTEADGVTKGNAPNITVQYLSTESYGDVETPPLLSDILDVENTSKVAEFDFDPTLDIVVCTEHALSVDINQPLFDVSVERLQS